MQKPRLAAAFFSSRGGGRHPPRGLSMRPRPRETTMTTQAATTNHQIRLARRPVGLPTRSDWTFSAEPVVQPEAGGVLVKTLMLSLDPAMRGWMNEGKSYIAPVGIGEVMRAGGVGVVVASEDKRFAPGDHVSGLLGVQEYPSFD